MPPASLLVRAIPYEDPFAAFRRFADLPGAVFLDSARIDGRLGRYKWPARIVVWDALPRSGYGKVPKAEVKRLLAERGEI